MGSLDIVSTITDVFSGGTTAIILKLVLAGALAVILKLVSNWIERVKIEAARKATQERRLEDQGSVVSENQTISQDAKDAEREIREMYKKK